MKLKDSVILDNLDGKDVLVDSDNSLNGFNGMISFNKTSKRILELLKNDTSIDKIVDTLYVEYEVDKSVLNKDVIKVVDKLKSLGLIDE